MKEISIKRWPGLSTIVVLILTYTLVYSSENAFQRIIYYERDLSPFPAFWRIELISAAFPPLILILIAALAWFSLSFLPPNWMGAICHLLFGLFIIIFRFYSYLYLLLPDNFYGYGLLQQFRNRLMGLGAEGCQSPIFYLASGSLLIAAAALIRYRRQIG